MPRYIDFDKLIEKSECGTDPRDIYSDMSFVRVADIEDMPAEDVQTVNHGKWLICSDADYPYCSECGEETEGKIAKFCPNCGSQMDGD